MDNHFLSCRQRSQGSGNYSAIVIAQPWDNHNGNLLPPLLNLKKKKLNDNLVSNKVQKSLRDLVAL